MAHTRESLGKYTKFRSVHGVFWLSCVINSYKFYQSLSCKLKCVHPIMLKAS